jgi:hypothetical protein
VRQAKLQFLVRSPQTHAMLILALSVLAIAWLSQILPKIKFPVSNDGIGYIEEARNFAAGYGIVGTPWGVTPCDRSPVPNAFHPPGYPIAIAAVSFLGISEIDAALRITRVCWMILPVAIIFALSPILGVLPATVCAVLAVTAPSLYLHGFGTYSEPLYLLLIAISVGLLLRGMAKDRDATRSRLLLLSAGTLAGAAYTVRNSGVAYYAAVYGAIFFSALLGVINFRHLARISTYFTIGTLPVVAALVWRNVTLFGEIQPYDMMRGHFASILTSVRVTLEAVLWDISGSKPVGQLAWDAFLLVVILVPIVAVLGMSLLRRWSQLPQTSRFFAFFVVLFLADTIAMLVIAHSFHGLDPGWLIRHVAPVSWLLFALLWLATSGTLTPHGSFVAKSIALVILMSHIWYLFVDVRGAQSALRILMRKADIVEAARFLPREQTQ